MKRILSAFTFVFLFVALIFITSGCSTPSMTTQAHQDNLSAQDFQLQFVGDQILPERWSGSPIKVGGLSGLTWSQPNNKLLAVSDDRGGRAGPSRFYEFDLVVTASKDNGHQMRVDLKKEHILTNERGENFPDRSFDPEGIAVGPQNSVLISTEGDFLANRSAVPGILEVNIQGVVKHIASIGPPFYPADSQWKAGEYGVQENKSLESLDYNHSDKTLVTTSETSLFQDRSETDRQTGARIRLTRFLLDQTLPGKKLSEKVYNISTLPKDSDASAFVGVADLINLGEERYLVLERTYLAKRKKNVIELFLANCQEASDVQAIKSLVKAAFTPCRKDRVYDFSKLTGKLSSQHPRVDNIEGMTLGPRLDDGSQSLVFVSDNNFSQHQKTQFLFFTFE